MRLIDANDTEAFNRFIRGGVAARDRTTRDARRIVEDVRRAGDAAARRWSARLDGFSGPFRVGERVLQRGWDRTPRDVRAAIRLAVRHLERVAAAQLPRPRAVMPAAGVRIDIQPQPLERVGCYVPGGRFPLVSSLIMTVVPARAAGVAEVVVACPSVTPAICCAALEAGASQLLRIGGAQAIAALAFGTRSIPRVDKIVGPGNRWVSAAKALVSQTCAIDGHAGPSEIVIWSATGDADWIAADLIAQAEHDPDARAIVVTTRPALAGRVADAISRRLAREPNAAAALRRNGAIVRATGRREAARIVNRLAAEHVVCDTAADAALVRHAGTVFVGPWSAQAAGDYTTGSNHVLPTGGWARARAGLSVLDFVRMRTTQTLTRRGLARIGPAAITLARAEGLSAHATSIACRLRAGGAAPAKGVTR